MLKKLAGPVLAVILFSCKQSPKNIADPVFADSLLANYSTGPSGQAIDGNLAFWKKRMDSLPDNFVNGPEYAAALTARFRLHGDIHDLHKADSLYRRVNEANLGKEPGIWRTLAGLASLQHQFEKADSFLKKSVLIEGSTFPNVFLDFDISFERGDYKRANILLSSLKAGNQYGYLFRRSKYEHYDGSLDSSIACMTRAAEKAAGNNYLTQSALSNAADLYIHKGELQKAYELYIQSIKMGAADLHSLTGLGWIALVHDKNDSLAENIFRFVHNHTQSPDILLKLEQLEESRNNIKKAKEYAEEFVRRAGDSLYGKMYSKYLIDLYTGILQQPGKAVALSLAETGNRPTPQVYAWYAWSLYCNNEKDKAWITYKGHVSGRPLEGPELYYMGKMMEGMDKAYNAKQFFDAAWKNRYDLDPVKQEELKKRRG